MTARELALAAIDDAGYQLDKAVEGLTPEQWQAKPATGGMSAVETLAHLTDCYTAYSKSCRGEEHEWGSAVPPTDDPAFVLDAFRKARKDAVAMVTDDEKAVKDSVAYIILHDAYHVGQVCATRVSLDPEWDAYSIYNF